MLEVERPQQISTATTGLKPNRHTEDGIANRIGPTAVDDSAASARPFTVVAAVWTREPPRPLAARLFSRRGEDSCALVAPRAAHEHVMREVMNGRLLIPKHPIVL